MITHKECIPCFFRQAHEMAQLASRNPVIQSQIIHKVRDLVENIQEEITPPEMARNIYKVVEIIVGPKDLYREIKRESNKKALALYPRLKKKVSGAEDSFLTAVETAISGNIIDYGAKNFLNIEKEIDKLFLDDLKIEDKKVFQYDDFKKDIDTTKEILYLADNAGEIVFDKVFIEELNAMGKKVIFAVRDKPIINDALKEDAVACGIDKVACLITSGSDAPGTILKYCSKEFQELFKKASFIISKGQGNYETLSQQKDPLIYFLFKVKCPIVAENVGAKVGDIVLKKNRNVELS
ncbi:MAG: ARMT1-like domain-containing protein [Candidatus Aceula meridiana]|nr:ARMT1-like domain-containing protein [Candidatus Aceula meridiana]